VDLASVAREVVAELEPLAEAKGVELRLGHLDTAPVIGHAHALRTLARNLADNAIRYTPSGGRVVIETSMRDGRAVLEVSDTGPGIPAAERGRVFDRFYRVPGTGAQGSGLGLANAREIAQAHRAEIELGEVEEGKGLRAAVRFPAGQVKGLNRRNSA
jgi:two-component system OmpR family sensor kinase